MEETGLNKAVPKHRMVIVGVVLAAFAALALLPLLAPSDAEPMPERYDSRPPPNRITNEDLDGAWPLTVGPPMYAYCPRGDVVAAIEVDGEHYGINGPGKALGRERGWPAIEQIWKRGEAVPRVYIGGLVDAVRERCKEISN